MPDILKLFESPPENQAFTIHTQSSLNCYMKCPKLYEYRYELHYRTAADIPALLIGTAVHVGIEWFWKGASYHAAMVKVCEYLGKEPYFSGDGKVDAARISAYIKGYYQRWTKDRENYVVIGVELTFYAFGGRAGKLDVLVRRKSDGQLIIIEHKTAGPYSKADEAGSAYWQKLPMDTQVCFYVDAVADITGETPLIMYDVILKTRSSPLKSKARKKKDETDAEFLARKNADHETLAQYRARVMELYSAECKVRYFRNIIHLTAEEIALKNEELSVIANQIQDNEDEDGKAKARYRNTSSCNGYGSTCEFIGVCVGIEQLDDPKFMKKETAHEELKEETP